jgi:hypothetical protein
MTPFPRQSPKEKIETEALNICITMYIGRTYECTSRILKKLSQMFQNYSELYLAVSPPTVQAAFREG